MIIKAQNPRLIESVVVADGYTSFAMAASSGPDTVSVTMGNCHQGNPIFGRHAGTQCTAVAFVAIILSATLSVSEWEADDFTNIIHQGSLIDSEILQSRNLNASPSQHFDNSFLLHTELPRSVYLHNNTNYQNRDSVVNVDLICDQFFGVVGHSDTHGTAGIGTTLYDALNLAFALAPTLLATFSDVTGAIFSTPNGFVIFDSHSIDAPLFLVE